MGKPGLVERPEWGREPSRVNDVDPGPQARTTLPCSCGRPPYWPSAKSCPSQDTVCTGRVFAHGAWPGHGTRAHCVPRGPRPLTPGHTTSITITTAQCPPPHPPPLFPCSQAHPLLSPTTLSPALTPDRHHPWPLHHTLRPTSPTACTPDAPCPHCPLSPGSLGLGPSPPSTPGRAREVWRAEPLALQGWASHRRRPARGSVAPNRLVGLNVLGTGEGPRHGLCPALGHSVQWATWAILLPSGGGGPAEMAWG